jgi:nitrogenase molybdenum-iron cofactor biosynthesis protein NifN
MGSEESISKAIDELITKNSPALIGVLTTGLTEVKGDDVAGSVKKLAGSCDSGIVYVSTPDYEGGLESGYARAVEAVIDAVTLKSRHRSSSLHAGLINVLCGSHLTPSDFTEIRETIEAFGLKPVMIPDLAALDGSRKGVSALAVGGTTIEEIEEAANAEFTLAIGSSMESPAIRLKERFGIEYRVLGSLSGLNDLNMFMETLSMISGRPMPARFERQRSIMVDAMRDAHFYFSGKRACLALEPDHAFVMAGLLAEMGAVAVRTIIPQYAPSASAIKSQEVIVGDLNSVGDGFDILISNSHAEEAAKRLNVPLYQTGFPVYKILGNTARLTIGYRGTLDVINGVGNLLISAH